MFEVDVKNMTEKKEEEHQIMFGVMMYMIPNR